MPRKRKMTPAELRAEAERIEREELKAENLKTADKTPTCPECGGRSFEIDAYTVVSQSIDFDRDEEHGDWDDDYESGDHTDTNCGATCNGCGADARRLLERHGWMFYGENPPLPALDKTQPDDTDPAPTWASYSKPKPSKEDIDAAFATLGSYFDGSASSQLLAELEGIRDTKES